MNITTFLIILIFLFLGVSIFLGFILFKSFNKSSYEENFDHSKRDERFLAEMENIKGNIESMKGYIDTNINNKFIQFSDSMNKNFRENGSENNKVFSEISEKISAFSEGNKIYKENIEKLGMEVSTLSGILDNKQLRGLFGETNLYQILENVLGKNKELFERQHKLSNGTIVDAIVFSPEPLGAIAIDSKFPMENYNRMIKKDINDSERLVHEKNFKKDLKTHINDISNKYLIKEETSDNAIMFIPAESIFIEIHNSHSDLVSYARDKKVIISSPSTLIAIISTIQSAVMNIKRSENLDKIEKSLVILSEDFVRFAERWEKISRSSKSTLNQINDFEISVNKISKNFEKINN